MKSVVFLPAFQLGFTTVLFKVRRNGNCARWPLGFIWCEEGKAAKCSQEYFLWVSG